MKKILILIILGLSSVSFVSADEEDKKKVNELRSQHTELKAKVDSGEITKEYAIEQWREVILEAREEREKKYKEKKEKIEERIGEIRERNLERAKILQERLENHEKIREERKQEFKDIKARVKNSEITKEEAKKMLSENRDEKKQKFEDNRKKMLLEKRKEGINVREEVSTTLLLQEYETGIHTDTLQINGEERNFKYYIPKNLSEKTSLLFRFHASTAISASSDKELPDPVRSITENYVLNKIADTENIIVVYPVGSLVKSTRSTIGWNDTQLELFFFDELLQYFQDKFTTISSEQIFVTGHSSGAIFSFALAGYRADKITAAVSVSGQYRLVAEGNDNFIHDQISTPLRAYNGVIDESVRYGAVLNNIGRWVELENKGDSDSKILSNIIIDNYDIDVTKWTGGISDIELYTIKDTGHGISWNSIGESMWDFMKSQIKN